MIKYVRESFEELAQNVTWTSRSQAQQYLVLVVVFSVLFSLLIAGMDIMFEELIALVLKSI